jgi:hypothetical protein
MDSEHSTRCRGCVNRGERGERMRFMAILLVDASCPPSPHPRSLSTGWRGRAHGGQERGHWEGGGFLPHQRAGGSAALYIRKGQPWFGRPEGAVPFGDGSRSRKVGVPPLQGRPPSAPTGSPPAPTGSPPAPTDSPSAPTGPLSAPTGSPSAPTGSPPAPTGSPFAPTSSPSSLIPSAGAPTRPRSLPLASVVLPSGFPAAPCLAVLDPKRGRCPPSALRCLPSLGRNRAISGGNRGRRGTFRESVPLR